MMTASKTSRSRKAIEEAFAPVDKVVTYGEDDSVGGAMLRSKKTERIRLSKG